MSDTYTGTDDLPADDSILPFGGDEAGPFHQSSKSMP